MEVADGTVASRDSGEELEFNSVKVPCQLHPARKHCHRNWHSAKATGILVEKVVSRATKLAYNGLIRFLTTGEDESEGQMDRGGGRAPCRGRIVECREQNRIKVSTGGKFDEGHNHQKFLWLINATVCDQNA